MSTKIENVINRAVAKAVVDHDLNGQNKRLENQLRKLGEQILFGLGKQKQANRIIDSSPDLIELEAKATIEMAGGSGSPKRISAVGYDGGILQIAGTGGHPCVVDLEGMEIANNVKALLQHDTLRPVGHFDDIRITDKIEANGVLSVQGKDTDEVINTGRNGFPWEMSIGFSVVQPKHQTVEFVAAGNKVTVNGRSFTGPILIMRKTKLDEISFVGQGGGQNTSVRFAAARKYDGMFSLTAAKAVSKVITSEIDRLETKGGNREEIIRRLAESSETTPDFVNEIISGSSAIPSVELLQSFAEVFDIDAQLLIEAANEDGANYEEELEMSKESIDKIAEKVTEKVTANMEARFDRMTASQQIRDFARTHHMDPDCELVGKLQANAAQEGWDARRMELEVLRASRNYNPGGGVFEPAGGNTGGRPASKDVLTAALGKTLGNFDEDFIAEQYGEKVADTLTASKWKNLGLKGMVVEFLHANGHHVTGGEVGDEDIRSMFSIADRLQASGGMSTFSLPVALGDYANKELLRSFRAIPEQLRKIAARTSNNDFKPKRLFRLSLAKGFEEVGADGQYPSARLTETSFLAEVRERGMKLAITNRDIQNDDASAFRDLLRQFSSEAAHTIEETLATVLLGGVGTFFAAAKDNRLTGAGSNLTFDNLALAEASMDAFVETGDDGQAGRTRNVEGKYLVAAPGAPFTTARQIWQSTNLSFISTDRQAEANIYNEMYEPVKAKYFGNGKVANATGNQWMLTADPAVTSPLMLALFKGQETPQVTTWNKIPGQSGMQWDVVLNFGASLHDAMAAVFDDGTAPA